MLWRSDKGKNNTTHGEPVETQEMQDMQEMQEMPERGEAAKVYENIQDLRESLSALKDTEESEAVQPASPKAAAAPKTADEKAIEQAQKAVLERARKDQLEAQEKQLQSQRLAEEAKRQQARILEGRKRLSQLEEEARKKRQEAEAAAERAREVERIKLRENFLAARREEEAAKARNQAAIEAEVLAKEKEKIEEKSRLEMAKKQAQLERAQDAAMDRAKRKDQVEAVRRRREQEREEARLRKIREAEEARARRIQADREAEEARLRKIKEQAEERARKAQLAEEAKIRKIRQAEEARARKAEEAAAIRAAKAEAIAAARAKKAAEIAEAKAKREAEQAAIRAKKEAAAAAARKAKEERLQRQKMLAEEKQKARLYKEQKKAEERKKRYEADEARRAERHAKAKALKEERDRKAELRRKERIARKTAEMGGGVVNIHGTQVSTEIKPIAQFSWKDLLGLRSREEKMATSEEELQRLQEERERKTEEAREVASTLRQVRASRFANSKFGRTMARINAFCEERKKGLLVSLGVLLIVLLCTAGVFNHYTAYEYSYNGRDLGFVKSKDDVLQITDMVQQALTEDKDMTVVISARDDISFKRVLTFNKDITLDDTDAVLKRLTYMGDINVKAYGIYIDGDKVGAVESKQVAADVLQDIKDKYKSKKKGAEIEEAVIVEHVEVKRSNTPLRELSSERQMVDTLCTSGHKETLHTVVAGETLSDLAMMYNTTEENLLADNPEVTPEKLVVGGTIVVKQHAPVMTVRITEVRTYDKTIKYKTKKKKSDEMYEGDEKVEQEGENGLTELTDRTVSVNGEIVETKNLKSEVKREPTTKIVVVGTQERPPTVGSGKFIWPIKGGHTVTSGFGGRWGRMHEGIDIGVPTGTPVYAADGGTVTTASYAGAYGNLVVIDHQNGMETRYGHNSSLVVSPGDKVYQGQLIAYAGSTGRSTGPHCHFEIRVNGTAYDPLGYLP